MYPEDRVLVGVMPDPRDLEIARTQNWYRVPGKNAPQGIHAEYVAFYFTKKFDPELRWAIHFYARRTGHELVRRSDLLPDQPNHPRANEMYYKLQLGPLKRKEPPIVSLRWRRITFIHTTWDRFVAAREINDLYRSDDIFVDRVYHALKQRGIQPDRDVEVREGGARYMVEILIPCKDGAVMLSSKPERPSRALALVGDGEHDIETIQTAIQQHGGPLMVDLPF
jgi:catechol 2,3-dioxygenase-like lactoylglutathione lyase family enzyme